MPSDVGLEEFHEEGVAFFWDRARAAELCWLLSFVVLLARLQALLALRVLWGAEVERKRQRRMLGEFSMQTFTLYIGIHVIKAIFPAAWRFHEAGFLDLFSALAALACLGFIFWLGDGLPMDAIGHGFLERMWPLLPGRKRGLVRRASEQCLLPAFAAVLVLPVHWAQPWQLRKRDEQSGLWPMSADFMQMLDTVAILPQFMKFHNMSADEGSKATHVSPILATWLAFVAVGRFLAFLSGFLNVVEELFDDGRWNTMEMFYSACSGINLAVVSEYICFYLRAWWHGARNVVLPV